MGGPSVDLAEPGLMGGRPVEPGELGLNGGRSVELGEPGLKDDRSAGPGEPAVKGWVASGFPADGGLAPNGCAADDLPVTGGTV
jgi:hypothetical protein